MIDFRYHLVSTIAIFMALALGIVVGTTQLNDQVLDNLKSSISNLTQDKRALEGSTRQLQSQVSQGDAFVESVTGELVGRRLTGETVLLVTVPGTPDELTGLLTPVLEQAGAEVVGRLQLKDALLDPARGQQVDDLVTLVRPPAVELPTGEPVARAAALIALALLRDPADTGVSEASAETILGAMQGEDLVDLDRTEGAGRRAGLVLVLTPGADGSELDLQETGRETSMLTVVSGLDQRSRGVVVAGPLDSVRDGGLVAAIRDDAALFDEVSTVDTVDRPLGRVLAVTALSDQVQGIARRYGSGPGATTVLPTPSPS